MSRITVNAVTKHLTCPNCGQQVTVHIVFGGYVCPLCGYKGHSGGAETKEGRRMARPSDVTDRLREASRADSLADTTRLVAEAQQIQGQFLAEAAADREVDLGNAIVHDHLTPARVHELHTAATDWIGAEDTTGGGDVERNMIAQGSLWYSKLHLAVKGDRDEFEQQAVGYGRRLAGAYGESAPRAEEAFLTHVGALWGREAKAGAFTAASGVGQVGDEGMPVAESTVGPSVDPGLPGDATSSNRAPAMQALDAAPSAQPVLDQADADADNGDSGTAPGDAAAQHAAAYSAYPGVDDPSAIQDALRGMSRDEVQRSLDRLHEQGHGEHGLTKLINDHLNIRDNLGSAFATRKEASMQTAPCPSCGGHGRVAVRRQGASGLPQIEEIVDPNNNPHSENPSLTEGSPLSNVMWPLNPGGDMQGNAIAETEQQLAQREQLKGASRARVAQRAAEEVYNRVLAAQDDSGWLGDMGAGGVGPGEQDFTGQGPVDSIGMADPVYGQGGDNGNQPLRPYGQDEADDETNKPSTWTPGQPLQNDVGGRGESTSPGASMISQSMLRNDPEMAKAMRFLEQRASLHRQQGRS